MKAKSANHASPAVFLLGGKGQPPRTRQRAGDGLQGLQPGGDGRGRPAGAAGLRAVDRFLPRVRRVQRTGARQPARDARRGHSPHRARERTRLRRPAQAAAGVGAQRGAGLDARHDGDRARCRRQRRDRARDRPRHRQSAPRLGLLSSPGPELRGGGARAAHPRPSRPASNAASVACGAASPQEIDFRSLAELTRDFLTLFEEQTGAPFPQDPMAQLEAATLAVFRSWRSAKAATYRKTHGLDDATGTAVTVQRMVFGNAGGMSGAGVAFTRDPSTGANALYMDFLFNAQGEDVVSGRRAVDARDAAWPALAGGGGPARARGADARVPLPRCAGARVHDRGRCALSAADAHRQAHAVGRAAHRGGAGRSGVDRRRARARPPRGDRSRWHSGDELRASRRGRGARPCGVRWRGHRGGRIALDSDTAARWAAEGEDVVLVRSEALDLRHRRHRRLPAAFSRPSADVLRTQRWWRASSARSVSSAAAISRSTWPPGAAASARRTLAEGDWLCLDGNAGRVLAGQPRARHAAADRVAAAGGRAGRERQGDSIIYARPTSSRKGSPGSLDGGRYRAGRGKCRYRSGRGDGTDIIRRSRDLHWGEATAEEVLRRATTARDMLIAAAMTPSLAAAPEPALWLIRSWRATKRPGAASVALPM